MEGLGASKYGRAEDSKKRSQGGQVVVRHIPILIQGQENRGQLFV